MNNNNKIWVIPKELRGFLYNHKFVRWIFANTKFRYFDFETFTLKEIKTIE